MYNVNYTDEAFREAKNLDGSIRRHVAKAVDELKNFPKCTELKPMQGVRLGIWRKKFKRNWRIIFYVDDSKLEITVLRIGHRREVYKDI